VSSGETYDGSRDALFQPVFVMQIAQDVLRSDFSQSPGNLALALLIVARVCPWLFLEYSGLGWSVAVLGCSA
jgi:hypothetical protein